MTNLIISTIAQGLLWALLALGVFITFRILDVADLTVEGSFPMGAAISAVLITMGVNPWITVIVAGIGGMIAGAVTGCITSWYLNHDCLVFCELTYYGESKYLLIAHGYGVLRHS